MKYASNDPYITIGGDDEKDYTDIVNKIKSSNYDFIIEIEAFRSSKHNIDVDKSCEEILKEISNILNISPENIIDYYNNKKLLLLPIYKIFLISIGKYDFLETYMDLYNKGEQLCLVYETGPNKGITDEYSISAICIHKYKRKETFDDIMNFYWYIDESINKANDIRKQKVYKEYNTKLIFSKIYNLDLLSAENIMLPILYMEPSNQHEYETISKVDTIVKSNTDIPIDTTWLGVSIINYDYDNIEEVINRLPYVIQELNEHNSFKK